MIKLNPLTGDFDDVGFPARTITGTTNQISVSNGDGVSGNPTLSLPSAITAPGSLTITGHLSPLTDSLYTNGTSSLYWSNTYTDRLYLNATSYLDGASSRTTAVGDFYINTSGQARLFSTRYGANSNGANIFIGGGGQNSVGVVGQGWKGSANTSLGVNALNAITTGENNTSVGAYALQSLTTGTGNVALGVNALINTSSGSGNLGIGSSVMGTNTSGVNNLAFGAQALSGNTTGNSNVAMGENAGRWLADGSTANQTASLGLYIGTNTKANAAAQTNETVIGYNATGNGSNTVTIGSTAVTANYFSGNIESTTTGAGIIVKSPDGTRYKLTIANGGTVTVSAA